MEKLKRVFALAIVSAIMILALAPHSAVKVSATDNTTYYDGVWGYRVEDDYAVLVGVSEVQNGEVCGPPSTLNGYPLKVISGINCGALAGIRTKQFIIPQGVERITQQAFNTGGFSSVVMPLSLKTIGFNAFVNCYGFNTVYYEGTASDWSKIYIDYPGLSNEWSINATRYYNYDYNSKYDVDEYKADTTDYISIHSAFSSFMNDQLIRDNYGFYEQIWKYELTNHRKWWSNRLGAYRAWDTLGDIGKLASFKINGYSLSVDYYELFLNDLVMAMNNKTIEEKVKIKSMENYSKYYGILEKIFKTTNEWDYSITHSPDIQFEIKEYLFKPDYKLSDGARLALNSILKEAFTEDKEEIITQVFEGFAGAKALFDEVSSATDMINVFIEGYNTYILAKSYCEVSPEFFAILDRAIEKMDNRTYANWLSEDLNKMRDISTIDIIFDVIKTSAWEGGVFVYNTFVKSALNNIAINYLSSLTGYAPSVFGISVFTYNTTYMLLDAVTGISKEAESYYLMNYIAPLEKALCEVEYEYGKTLRENQTIENAIKYDYAYSVLKQTELYLFQCAYDFSDTKYQHSLHSWSTDKTVGYFEDMKIISVYQDLWTKLNCHKGTYTPLDDNKNIANSLQQDTPESNEVVSVSFSKTICQLPINLKTKNVATAYPTYATGRKITYETSDSKIARVNYDGTIIPVSEGTVTITATSLNGTTAVCQVAIVPFETNGWSDRFRIDRYVGNNNEVVIPEYINDKPVKEISYHAFYTSESLSRVVIPESVTTIDKNAFNKTFADALIICGVWGSYAQQYAIKNGFAFECVHKFETYVYDGSTSESADGTKTAYCLYGCGTVNTVTDDELKDLPKLNFSKASITIQSNLQINYKVPKETVDCYSNVYVVFDFAGRTKKVSEYTTDGNYYVFCFDNIAPNQIGETAVASLHGTYRDTECRGETKEYSVAQYCYNMLSKYPSNEYAKLRTLLVDLLNYGAQSQIYTEHSTDALATANLTVEQTAWGTQEAPNLQSVMEQNYATVESPSVTWKGAGLNLQDSVTMRFKIAADNIGGLSVKVTGNSGQWTIDYSEFEKTTGGYYIYFRELNAGQMSEPVYLTVYDGDTPISNTIRYSIESYAYAKQNSPDEKLNNLLSAMMKYGNSAYAYIN